MWLNGLVGLVGFLDGFCDCWIGMGIGKRISRRGAETQRREERVT